MRRGAREEKEGARKSKPKERLISCSGFVILIADAPSLLGAFLPSRSLGTSQHARRSSCTTSEPPPGVYALRSITGTREKARPP